eukprot:TRINITY_DN139_c0_g2_i1.p1 TRINITY_DN139_c0_g2~~TRINITY_DN139_c0_g2_i1.p1  ORF type:complete len:114 (+),score=19.30 TRINITY_DN139_c0_g2_i1:556-897(+)
MFLFSCQHLLLPSEVLNSKKVNQQQPPTTTHPIPTQPTINRLTVFACCLTCVCDFVLTYSDILFQLPLPKVSIPLKNNICSSSVQWIFTYSGLNARDQNQSSLDLGHFHTSLT